MRAPIVSISAPRLLAGVFAFFSLSALVGGAQFWYTSQYLPSSEGVSLTIESDLHELGRRGDTDIVELTLTVHNTSHIQAEILGSVYRISGSTTRSVALSDDQMRHTLARPLEYGETVSRYRRGGDWDLLQVGPVFSEGSWLDPGEKFSTSALIDVPRSRYDTMRSQVQVMIAKRRALSLDYGRFEQHRLNPDRWPIEAVVTTLPIEETSWFRELTRGNRLLQIKWVTARDPQHRYSFPLGRFPHLSDAIVREGADAGPGFTPYSEQTGELYGIASAISTRAAPLELDP